MIRFIRLNISHFFHFDLRRLFEFELANFESELDDLPEDSASANSGELCRIELRGFADSFTAECARWICFRVKISSLLAKLNFNVLFLDFKKTTTEQWIFIKHERFARGIFISIYEISINDPCLVSLNGWPFGGIVSDLSCLFGTGSIDRRSRDCVRSFVLLRLSEKP